MDKPASFHVLVVLRTLTGQLKPVGSVRSWGGVLIWTGAYEVQWCLLELISQRAVSQELRHAGTPLAGADNRLCG